MTRATTLLSSGLSAGLVLFACGCGENARQPGAGVDCSVADAYEFRNIFSFAAGDAGWYQYADPTPGGVPDTIYDAENSADNPIDGNPVALSLDPPACSPDNLGLKLEAYGHNFWGAGFADYQHNQETARADGTGYEGIALWARSAPNTDKSFLLQVDDRRTVKLDPVQFGAQDANGDGVIGNPGDVVNGTECRLPPPEELGDPSCYNGGVDAPGSATRVPAADECGNAFHTVINTTDEWQLFFIPWSALVQWPCPNRLAGGINPADIAKFEIKFEQGTHYEIWIDSFEFYRRRTTPSD